MGHIPGPLLSVVQDQRAPYNGFQGTYELEE
jgi:hypothetical protein